MGLVGTIDLRKSATPGMAPTDSCDWMSPALKASAACPGIGQIIRRAGTTTAAIAVDSQRSPRKNNTDLSARRSPRILSAVREIPVISRATTSGMIVIRSKSSHKPPISSPVEMAPWSPVPFIATQSAPPATPATSAVNIRQVCGISSPRSIAFPSHRYSCVDAMALRVPTKNFHRGLVCSATHKNRFDPDLRIRTFYSIFIV